MKAAQAQPEVPIARPPARRHRQHRRRGRRRPVPLGRWSPAPTASTNRSSCTNRSNGGAPGYWVLTPLVQADGTAVVVNRGWIPFSYTEDGPWTDFDPPTGTVSVLGMVRAPQERGTAAGVGPAGRRPRACCARWPGSTSADSSSRSTRQLLPLYVDLRAQEPAQAGALPEPIPEPELDEGPHLSYAGQWFIFALLTLIFLPLFIRWTAAAGGWRRRPTRTARSSTWAAPTVTAAHRR